MDNQRQPAAEKRGGHPQRRWRAIEPQLDQLGALTDDLYEAGQIPEPAYGALNKAINRLKDDYAEMVDSLDRMIRLAHVPAGQRAA